MKYLVTGGVGFIGGHTVEALLNRGDHVVVIDNMNSYYDPAIKMETLHILNSLSSRLKEGSFIFYHMDLLDSDSVNKIYDETKPDVLLHLAAQAGVRYSIDHSTENVQINITATVTLLECARRNKTSNVVIASSSSVYGKSSQPPFREDSICDKPISPYAATKRACELFASTFSHLYGLKITMLRFFTVYGPRGRPDMAVYKFIDRSFRNLPVDKFGDGSAIREFTYISDIVRGVLAAVDCPHDFLIVNLGGGATHSLNDLMNTIEKAVNRPLIVNQLDDQPGDVPMTSACQEVAQRELGFFPLVSLEEGISLTVKWFIESRLFGDLESKVTVVEGLKTISQSTVTEPTNAGFSPSSVSPCRVENGNENCYVSTCQKYD